MTFRPGPLRAAAALAAGFVAVRVVYRVLFHGADGSGAVLLPMSVIRMPAPFAHVQVLGPVTVDGLAAAALSAVPIALTILAFGALSSVLDMPRMLARGARSGPFQGLARALAVAWATLPGLADAVRAVRFAQRLRGGSGRGRRGLGGAGRRGFGHGGGAGARVLSPILERTLERATAVGAALELRGYAGRGLEGDCAQPVVMRDAVLGFGPVAGAQPLGVQQSVGHSPGATHRAEATVEPGAARPSVVQQSVGHSPGATHRAEATAEREGYPGGATLRVAELTLETGALTLLTGPTGSGKSTLLRTLAGLHTHVDGGWATGRIEVVGLDRTAVAPRDTARTVGVVLQNPRAGFATETVRDEIGLALELRGVAPVLVAARVDEVAARIGISDLLDRRVRTLSAGQATLVAIAAAIVEHPILLLVDEPLADLDAASRTRIVELLADLAHDAGMCVLVAEHHAAEFSAVADRWLGVRDGVLEDGSGFESGSGLRAAASTTPAIRAENGEKPLPSASAAPNCRSHSGRAGDPALQVTGLTVRHGRAVAVADADLSVQPGEVVAITGPNGAGKSSLLVALADEPGTALVPDASDDLFVRDTVADECRQADRAARRDERRARRNRGQGQATARSTAGDAPGAQATTAARFSALLRLDPDGAGFARRLAQHPRDLSTGERRCLAIALQTARRPTVLMLDEPTRGLDPAARALVARGIGELAETGVAVIVATHDREFVGEVADREVPIRGGVLGAAEAEVGGGAGVSTSRSALRSTDGGGGTQEPTGVSTPRSALRSTGGGRGFALRAAGEQTNGRSRARGWALVLANVAAAAAFLWPLVGSAVPSQAQAAVPYIALALAPVAVILVLAALDASVRSAQTLALLAVLAAIGAAIRIASTGVGGVEALFVLLILAGRAYGPRFGMLLGAASIALSAVMWGGIGPWLPFQMFACGWVGAGAGLLPRLTQSRANTNTNTRTEKAKHLELTVLCAYGIIAAYAFGLIMNMWFWPFAVGTATSISYVPGGSVGENLANFALYSLLTSTLTWDTLRAITTVVGLLVVGRAVLASLRRAKPLTQTLPERNPVTVARGRG